MCAFWSQFICSSIINVLLLLFSDINLGEEPVAKRRNLSLSLSLSLSFLVQRRNHSPSFLRKHLMYNPFLQLCYNPLIWTFRFIVGQPPRWFEPFDLLVVKELYQCAVVIAVFCFLCHITATNGRKLSLKLSINKLFENLDLCEGKIDI